MNSEFLKKLVEISKSNKAEIEKLKGEYKNLTDLDSKLSSKNSKRIIEIKKEISRLSSLNTELEEDLKYYNQLRNSIKNFKKGLDNQTNEDNKQLFREKIESLEAEYESFGEGLVEKYNLIVKDYEDKKAKEAEKERKAKEKEEKKANKKKINKSAAALALVALLGVGTAGYAIGRGKANSNTISTSKVGTNDENEKEEDKPEEKTNETNTSVVNSDIADRITFETEQEENLKFTDINDETQVEERAYEIVQSFDKISPIQGITIEDVMDYLRYINGGVVNEVSREAALNVISQIEVLMNNEMNYGVDMALKGSSEREKQDLRVDYSKFFIDGSLSQQLASKITTLRGEMLDNPTNKETQSVEFTKLLLNSWYLNGNEEINANALETSGSAALIDKLFLNTAMIAQANQDENYEITVNMGIVDENITLTEIIDEINKPNCPTMVTADNGETFETLMNKFSSDMEGMVKEAYYNKENSNALTLHK